ncbi:glucose 1-dehydrogenase [Telmatospirillum sp.]|uniref:glucose 1-dehydrogenase n=1 Tax=Telmatospirillum sp. TaxID=2079197 RepID=UPI00284C2400|nr:glucose 1-dehydrogenase [Telmatospirillum sp.]MDR3436806.1 glucose 1-dehydrogenase [Telmatospirillum sp.]
MLPAYLKNFDLTGQLALVTGSSAGIGFALARALGAAGASLVINGRNTAKVDEAVARLTKEGFKAHAVPFDVTDSAAVTRGVDHIASAIGAIDILVNNAGMTFRSPLEDFPEEQWHNIMRTNLDSVFLVSKAVVHHMIPRKSGKIVNICSVQSELGRPTIAPYAASKGGLKMLTKGMAIDWGKYNIQVNAIGPGYFKTELTEKLVKDAVFTEWLVAHTPSKRWGDVEDLGGAMVFLASHASDFVNGHILYVDGGVTASL